MADYGQPPFVDKRLRFFDGQFLKDQDFIDEQKYHVDRLRRYSRFLNVSGIVDGLTVEASPNLVTVTPGTALDNQGRQVVLGKQVTVALQDYKGSLVDLVIAYNEETSDPQAGGGEATRFYERPYVGPRDKAPNKAADAIVLAQLRIDANGTVTVDITARIASGLRLPDGRIQDHNAWPALRVDNGAVALTGDLSVTGHLRLGPASTLAFANQTRQMINLWGLEYGIGIQNNTQYSRTYKNFAWYKGGSHHDDELNPGGGAVQLVVNDGNVGIGITPPTKRLHVEAGELRVRASHNNTTADIGAFLAQNLSQGIGIGYNRLEAIGSNANQDILIVPKGTGGVSMGGALSVAGTLSVTGASTLTGNVGIGASSALSFGNQTRQMINLWSTGYGIGVQNSTQYYRSDKNFAWYKGGSHHDVELNPGGGAVQLVINDGNVGIGITPPTKRLHVEAGELRVRASHNNATADIGAFLAQNLSQGIGIGYNRLEAIGSNTSQDIVIIPKGSGKVQIAGEFTVAGGSAVGGIPVIDFQSQQQRFAKQSGSRKVLTYTFTFPRPVLKAEPMLKSWFLRYESRELVQEALVGCYATRIAGNTVAVDVTFGLKDATGTYDDPYEGEAFVVVVALLSQAV